MEQKIRIGICGYGNLGKGVQKAICQNSDMELVAVFTRRDPTQISKQTSVKVLPITEVAQWMNQIDVMIMCGGSATDLPDQVPTFAKLFCTVDSFDTHAKIPQYLNAVDEEAKSGGNVSIISVGWDPGMFSNMRAYAEAILPFSHTYTFWGRGVSQGHSDAIRRIEGVKDARQYTIPVPKAMEMVRAGENPELSTREKHERECFVVAEDGADLSAIEKEIITMPNYFADYDTTVHFITQEELDKNHKGLPHGGSVISCGQTGEETKQVMEYSLTLDSNPEFTGAVLVAYARAAYRMKKEGITGAKTVLDVPPIMLNQNEREEVIKRLL
ncbi:MAG: diaminopimelate dehydrogenase [Clostridia bacterium]|jgi:diaminopimelate dehydrogenase|nr:diaminopimelate dehydrogenase [Clostridia bacterium]